MNNILIVIIGGVCNFMLLMFLARTNAYNLIKSKMTKEIIEKIYDGDCENNIVFTKIMNWLTFITCMIGGGYLAPQYWMEFWPIVVVILAKLWTKSMAKTKIRLYVLQKLIKEGCPVENFQEKFAVELPKMMKIIDSSYVFLPSDYPKYFELTTAFMEVEEQQRK